MYLISLNKRPGAYFRCQLKGFSGILLFVLAKVILKCLGVPRGMNSRFRIKTQLFLFVSGRRDAAHPNGHQYSVSIQSSIDLGKSSPNISNMKNCTDLNLGEAV